MPWASRSAWWPATEAEPAQPASSAYRLAPPELEPGPSEALGDAEADLRRRRLELERRQLEREEAATWHREIEALSAEIKRQTEITRRRDIVNEVCSPFADLLYTLKGYQIPPGTSDAAKRRAHEELARAGAGRSREEFVRIAQQAREQVYAPVLKAQDDARAAAARETAEREAIRAQQQDEARRRELAPPKLSLGFGNSTLGADRVMEDPEVTAGTDDDDEPEDNAEEGLKLEGESEFDDRGGDETDGDIEPEVEPDDEPAATGLAALFRLGAIALGVVALARLLNPPRVWISDPHTGGDGSFGVGSVAPGPNSPWRAASQAEIQQGLDSGALGQV